MNIFSKNKIYLFDQISEICSENNLTTVDCLKDENLISVEGFMDDELCGECLFEFDLIENDHFALRWSQFTD